MADSASNQSVVNIGVQELLDAGMHFGHQSKRWNPKMKRFIFGKRNGIYIIDLTKTIVQLKAAQQFVHYTVAQGRSVLFVGTKRQAQEPVKEAALRCGQHYINSRWLGGTLTNNRNICVSIKRMKMIEEMEEKGEMQSLPQKEVSRLRHELARHQRFLSGLANMSGMPGAMIVIDVNRESIAVKEANRMGIPVVATVDTNCDPDPIAYPIPGNDDSKRAVELVLNIMADTILQASAEYAGVVAQRQAEREAAKKEQNSKPQPAGSSAATDESEATRPRGADRRSGGDRRPRRSAPKRDSRKTDAKKTDNPAKDGPAPDSGKPEKNTAAGATAKS